jgi:hypothetical protein
MAQFASNNPLEGSSKKFNKTKILEQGTAMVWNKKFAKTLLL